MVLKSSVDKWPIILDSSGLPLSYGILYYTKVGTTTVPKSVYRDIARTDEFPNAVVECDANGRTVSQVFLCYGEYTVIAHRFAGADPLNTEPSDWCPDNQWTEYGLPIPEITIESHYTEVDTIADLRAVDTDLFTDCLVLGYYEAGDLEPRTYHWNGASGTLSENGGTTIESTHSTGFWTLAIGDTDVVDARIFGMFPIVVNCLPIMQMISYTLVGRGPISRCYVPAGVYSLGLTTDVLFHTPFIFDDGCQFTTTSATSYILAFPRGTEIRGNHCFTDIESTSLILPKFGWGAVVNPKWWYDCHSDGLEWGNALTRMVANIKSIDTILVSDSILLSTIDDVEITSNIHFTESGSITLNDPVGTLSFCGPCRITVDTGCLAPLRGSALYSYRFLRMPYIRSSWFTSAGSSLSSPYTEDLSLVVSANNATVANGCKLICDTAQSKFNTSLSNANASRITVSWESGKLVASSTITGHTVYLPQAELGAYNCIQGHGFILGCTTHLRNFVPAYTGSALVTNMFTAAMRSALQGSGTLDLDGYDVTTQTPELPNTLSVSSKSLYICNGTIRTPDTSSMLSVACSPESIILEGVEWVATTSALSSVMLNSYGVSTNINRILFDNVTCDGNTHENRSSVLNFPTTNVSYVNIIDSNLDAYTLGSGQIWNLHLGASTLPRGYSGSSVFGATILANGNRFVGAGDRVFSARGTTTIYTQNYCLSGELKNLSVYNTIAPVIYSNQFESTDADRCYLLFVANSVNVVFRGCIIYGNGFIGATTSSHFAIQIYSLNSCNFFVGDSHKICSMANSASSTYTLVPLTRGVPTLGNVTVDTRTGDNYTKSIEDVVLTNNPGILVIPGSSGSGCMGYIGVTRSRDFYRGEAQCSTGWSGKLVYDSLLATVTTSVKYPYSADVYDQFGTVPASIVIAIY